MPRIRRKKPRAKNMIYNQITPFKEKKKQSQNTDMKRHISVEVGSKSYQSNAKLRDKVIKNIVINRDNSKDSSRQLIKTP